MAIGLHQHQGDAAQHRGQAGGTGHVPTRAQHGMRAEPAQQRDGPGQRCQVDESRPRRGDRPLPGQRHHSEDAQVVTGLGHELSLDPLAPDEYDLGALSP